MKQLNITLLICFVLIGIQCSKKSNKAPSEVTLIFPTENLLCINNTIDFDWSDAIDPENDDIEYIFTLGTDISLNTVLERRTLTESKLTLTLDKATAYYWKIEALDINNNQGTSSETFAFITQGEVIENYVPFAATVLSPENETMINEGTIFLSWNAEDINNNDILTYELYFGEGSTPTLISNNLSSKNYEVTIESGKTYSWKVNVKDQNGAKSIGQVWTFSVN